MWRLIVASADHSLTPDAEAGFRNMAVDHALFEGVQLGGRPVLRFYRWQPACLSLGRNQPARFQRDALDSLGVDLVRRPTGGLAVLHDRELTYSVAVPAGCLGSPRATYEAINRALLAGLLELGVSALVASLDTTRVTFQKGGACFAGTAPGEVGVGGRKLIGSAQRFERHTILQHGSILLEGDQGAAEVMLGRPNVPGGGTSLRQVLGWTPEWTELVDALRLGFETELGIALAPARLDSKELSRALQLADHYASPEWTWRV